MGLCLFFIKYKKHIKIPRISCIPSLVTQLPDISMVVLLGFMVI